MCGRYDAIGKAGWGRELVRQSAQHSDRRKCCTCQPSPSLPPRKVKMRPPRCLTLSCAKCRRPCQQLPSPSAARVHTCLYRELHWQTPPHKRLWQHMGGGGGHRNRATRTFLGIGRIRTVKIMPWPLYPRGKHPRCRLGRPQSWAGRFGEEGTLWLLPRFTT
jgi:hypothetical protein